MAGEIVAHLEVKLAGGESKPATQLQSDIAIYGSEQFYLGRNSDVCRQSWPDPVISNRHLRIHCILYEQDPVSGIPPFVYATDLSTNGTYLRKSNLECASSQGDGIRMTRGSAFLLDDGDQLRLSDSVTLVYRSITPVQEAVLTPIQQREKQMFAHRYLVTGRVLGAGAFGTVMVGIHQRTQRQVACKIIDLRRLWPKLTASGLEYPLKRQEESLSQSAARISKCSPKVMKCFREFDILKDLSHPNIITIEKVFWSNNTIYIFQDLVSGGDLFSYLEYKGGKLNDIEAAVIIRQILTGVEYLHGQSVVHRDLKPDNILMTSLDDGCRIVISDFGNARYLPGVQDNSADGSVTTNSRMFSHAGTMEYAAPEIHKKNKTIPATAGYSKAVDMWSIGVITGTLLSGDIIFAPQGCSRSDPQYCETLLEVASRCDLSFLEDETHQVWRNVGTRPKDFIRNLLVLKEDRRMTATQALAHPWFSNRYHVGAFDALYEKCIRDWKARKSNRQLVEPVNLTNQQPQSGSIRVLEKNVISPRHFTPCHRISLDKNNERTAPSQLLKRQNEPLPSITEPRQADCAQRVAQVPDSGQPLQKIHPSQLVLRIRRTNKFTSDEMENDQAGSCGHWNKDPHYDDEGYSDYDFSVPAPPPETPSSEEDSILVPETPAHQLKRSSKIFEHGIRPDIGQSIHEHQKVEYSRQHAISFAKELSKRRRLR